MTEVEPTMIRKAICCRCLKVIPLVEYLGSDHYCPECSEWHEALLSGQEEKS